MNWRRPAWLHEVDVVGGAAVVAVLALMTWLAIGPVRNAAEAGRTLGAQSATLEARAVIEQAAQEKLRAERAELDAAVERMLTERPALADIGAARAGLLRCATEAGVTVATIVTQPTRQQGGAITADITLTGHARLTCFVGLLERAAAALPGGLVVDLACQRAAEDEAGCTFALTWRCRLVGVGAEGRRG